MNYERDPITEEIIGCAIEVHRHLGPGLLESVYEEALCIELRAVGVPYVRQEPVAVSYKGHRIGEHRPDLIVAAMVVVEIKSVDRLIGLHQAQTLMYMRLLSLRVGLLMNFNTPAIKHGIRRLAL